MRGYRSLVPFGAARIGDESLPVVAAGDIFQQPSLGRTTLVTDLNDDARPDVVTVTSGERFDPPWQLNIWLGNTPFECR